MITEEEFKKGRIRMWNSIRDKRYKDTESCDGCKCTKCIFFNICICRALNPYEQIRKMEQWLKDNPDTTETNLTAFNKEFGSSCIRKCGYPDLCEDYETCKQCKEYWNSPREKEQNNENI